MGSTLSPPKLSHIRIPSSALLGLVPHQEGNGNLAVKVTWAAPGTGCVSLCVVSSPGLETRGGAGVPDSGTPGCPRRAVHTRVYACGLCPSTRLYLFLYDSEWHIPHRTFWVFCAGGSHKPQVATE